MRGGSLPRLKSSFQKGLATSGSPSTTSRLDLASAEGNSLWRWAKRWLTSIRERWNQKIQGWANDPRHIIILIFLGIFTTLDEVLPISQVAGQRYVIVAATCTFVCPTGIGYGCV